MNLQGAGRRKSFEKDMGIFMTFLFLLQIQYIYIIMDGI